MKTKANPQAVESVPGASLQFNARQTHPVERGVRTELQVRRKETG